MGLSAGREAERQQCGSMTACSTCVVREGSMAGRPALEAAAKRDTHPPGVYDGRQRCTCHRGPVPRPQLMKVERPLLLRQAQQGRRGWGGEKGGKNSMLEQLARSWQASEQTRPFHTTPPPGRSADMDHHQHCPPAVALEPSRRHCPHPASQPLCVPMMKPSPACCEHC